MGDQILKKKNSLKGGKFQISANQELNSRKISYIVVASKQKTLLAFKTRE